MHFDYFCPQLKQKSEKNEKISITCHDGRFRLDSDGAANHPSNSREPHQCAAHRPAGGDESCPIWSGAVGTR